MSALVRSPILDKAARDHCLDTGPLGITSHTGSNGESMSMRIEKHGDWSGRIGENLAYGGTNGRGHMLQLYVDDGVYPRGHRDNILNTAFNFTGIAVC